MFHFVQKAKGVLTVMKHLFIRIPTSIEHGSFVVGEELHPEALYQFKVKDFGPLTVAMDIFNQQDLTRFT